MSTLHIFSVGKNEFKNVDVKKYVDTILSNVNTMDLQYSFHQRTNDETYESPDIQYANLYICLQKKRRFDKGNCIITIDSEEIKNSKSLLKFKILVAPKEFETNKIILVGHPFDNRIHLINIDIIKKYPACCILLCMRDSELNFDDKIVIDTDFETFDIILDVLRQKIDVTTVSTTILNEMDTLGLINP